MSEIMTANKAEMRKLSEIRPYERNARKHGKTIDLLCEMIPKVGFNVPLVIDPDGVIVKGHARYEAAKRLGMTEVPCIVTHADADAIRADRIADNKVQEFTKWNNEALMHEVDMLDLEYDFTDMGLPRASFDDFPAMDEFDATYASDYEDDAPAMSEEERRKKYLEFLEQQAKQEAENVQIATEYDLRAAMDKQKNVPKKQREYVRCTCKKCGHVFYFDKNVFYDKNGTTRR